MIRMRRWYIDNSPLFYNQGGYRKYIKKMKKVIREEGGKVPKMSNKFKWSPRVLCFLATDTQVKNIKIRLMNELGFPVIINEKTW